MRTVVSPLAAMVTAFLLTAPAASAGEPAQIPAKAIEMMGYFVGDWEADSHENGQKNGISIDRRSWGPGGNRLTMELAATEKAGDWRAAGIAGWDAKARAVVECWHDSRGDFVVIRYPLDKMKESICEGTWHIANPDGTSQDERCELKRTPQGFDFFVFSKKDGKNMVLRSVARRVGPEKTAAIAEPPQATGKQAIIPGKAVKAMNYLAGAWTGDGGSSGGIKVQVVRDERRWVVGKYCLRFEWSGSQDGQPTAYSAICGWDAKANALVEHWFGNRGQFMMNRYPLDRMKGNRWEGTFGITMGDGSTSTGECTFTAAPEKGTWTGRSTDAGKPVVFESTAYRVKTESDYRHLKPLEWLIGDWVGEYTAPVDFGPAKKGDRVVAYASRRWVLGRSAFTMDGTLEVNGKKSPLTYEVNYWDPAAGKVAMWAKSTFGTGRGAFATIGDRAVLEFAGHKEGVLAGTAVLEKVDGNSYTWHFTKVTLNGQKSPVWPKVTFRRKSGAADGDVWNAYREAIAGAWTGTADALEASPAVGLARGDKLEGTFTLRPELDGKALAGEMEFHAVNKPVSGKSRLLAGWDPMAQQVRLVGFWNTGSTEEMLLSSRQGTSFVGTFASKDPGAAPRQGRIRMDCPDPDTCVFTFLDGPYQGKVLSSWKRAKK